jgi:nicotinamide-nucleotide amidase
VVADFFNSPLEFNEEIFRRVKDRFEKYGKNMPQINRSQALVPAGAELMDNLVGTAPGMIFKNKGKWIFVMPGVPREMESMMNDSVIPTLRKECPECRVKVNLFRTTGIAESAIYEKIEEDLKKFPDYEIAFLPKFTGVDIRVIRNQNDQGDIQQFQKFWDMLYGQIGEFIYATEPVDLEEVVGRLLSERQQTIAVAESLTGGLIEDKLTDIPGSSHYFIGGVVAYSNEIKISQLGVQEGSLVEHGAVSEEVAGEMAAGIRKRFQVDLGLATTGIAGPTGATETKPIGLVYIGVADPSQVRVKKFNFGGDRQIVKQRAAQAALEMARRAILKLEI